MMVGGWNTYSRSMQLIEELPQLLTGPIRLSVITQCSNPFIAPRTMVVDFKTKLKSPQYDTLIVYTELGKNGDCESLGPLKTIPTETLPMIL